MITKAFKWFNDNFWYIIAFFNVTPLVINLFTHSLEVEEEILHSLALLISLVAIGIKRWLGNSMDFVQRIYDFNKDNGLIEKGYSDFLESSFQIEEALEGFNSLQSLASVLTDEECEPRVRDDASPKNISRAIVQLAKEGSYRADSTFRISDVDRLDKACDAIVFAVGSMAKLGLNPDQINRAINIVMDANSAKTGCPKDEYGKLMKPENFPEPEPRLQELLNECNN